MGYESKIYVVEKSSYSWRDDGKIYGSVIAMVDMSKCYQLSDVLRNKPVTNCYIYSEGSDNEIMEDRYGKPLTECNIHEAITLLEKVMQKDHYWRYDILYATLKGIAQFLTEDADNFVVLHYGY